MVVPALAVLLTPLGLAAPPEAAQPRRPDQLIARAGAVASADGAVRFLDRLRPTAETERVIADLIDSLGNENFVTREKATRRLTALGMVAHRQLVSASRHTDLEVALAARHLLDRIQQAKDSGAHDALLSTALEILGQESHRDTVKTILRTMPLLESEQHVDLACTALWFAVTSEDHDRIRQALRQDDEDIRAAAIPALEVAIGDRAVAELRPCLADQSDLIRLAAARALLDRLPVEALPVLVELLESDHVATRLRAAWLLSQVYDSPPGESNRMRLTAQAKVWRRKVADLDRAVEKIPLGIKRLQLKQYPAIFREDFTQKMAYVLDRYRELRYETTVKGARASARGGMARLHGDHDEGDQRLVITAQQLVGKAEFTDPFAVTAEIGGEAQGAGTYHAGVSIGNLRILFHPGYRGGGFRIERVDTRKYLISNQRMPFTPAAGVLHKMHISVHPQQDKTVLLKTTITNAHNPKQQYVINHLAQPADIGTLSRVAVERSGRVGGAALFGLFEVDFMGARE